jgi:DNA-directed RNA polymerase specialized sigma24 family protein
MENTPNTRSVQVRAEGFASTHWSVVLLAGGARNAPQVQEALARLCSAYWYPLYVFIRRQGHSADDAEDLAQEFFARFLDKDFLSTVDKSRGKFRTFLLACCQHFLANQRELGRAQKRGGARPALSLDFPGAAERYRAEPASVETAEKLFERRWALTVLDQTLEQMQREYEADGNDALFAHLKKVLVGGTKALSYARIGADLNMNEAAVRKAAQRLRQRYRSVLRERIADTVDEPERIDDEIRDLFAALSS